MARLLNLLAATGLALFSVHPLQAQEPAQLPAQEDPILLEVNGRAFPTSEILRFYIDRHDGHLSIVENESVLGILVDRVRDFYLLEAAARSEGLEEDALVQAGVEEFVLDAARSKWFEDQLTERLVVESEQVEEFADSLLQVYEIREIETKSRAQAERAVAALEAGRSFEEAVPLFSAVASRVRGGLREDIRLDVLPWQVAEWLNGKQPGDRSPVITHARGFSLIEVVSVTEEEPIPERIEERRLLVLLHDRERDRLIQTMRAELRTAANARVTAEIDPAWFLPDGGGDDELVVAVADGVEAVTLAKLRASFSLQPQAFEDSELVAEVAEFSALSLLDLELQANAAFEAGYDQNPEVLEEAQAVKEDLLVKALKSSLIYEDIEIPEEELLAIYESNREKYDQPAQAEVKHILVETEDEARELAVALQNGLDFAEAARTRSLDTSTGASGGYVGWVDERAILPELDAVIWDLPNGEISAPIQTQVGWHLITVLRRRPGQEVPFRAVRRRIFESEFRIRQRAQVNDWVALLLDRVPWKAYPENLPAAMEEVRRQLGASTETPAPAEHDF